MPFQGLVGVAVILAVAFALSENRAVVAWRKVAAGVMLAFVIGLSFTAVPPLASAMLALNGVVQILEESAQHGASFIFGYLAGAPAPFEVTKPEHGFIIAFRVFPLIMLVAVLSNIALHLGLIGRVIRWLSVPVKRVFGLSSQLALGAAASIFFGTIETPLVIKGHLKSLNRGELLALITCTMSTIAGTVMVLYAGVLKDAVPNALGHMMVASLMSVPCAIVVAQLLSPFAGAELSQETQLTSPYHGIGDAISSGIQEGLTMILSITATLIVVFALVYLLNRVLGFIPGFTSIEALLAIPLRPVLWSIGIPWIETAQAAALMAQKIVLNEFVAYLNLASADLTPRSSLITTYALCGFANLGSLGIVVSGLGQLLPERKSEIAGLCLKALLAGNLATLLTGALISLVL